MATSKDTISVTVVSDILCPWCYIGFRELENAIARFKTLHPSHEVRVEYRPFLLDPKLNCKEPVTRSEYYGKKFPPERFAQIGKVIGARGAALGINFNWNGQIRQTTSSHRVLMYAYQKDPKLQLVLLQKIFTASDEDGKDVGDHEILATLTEDAGVMTKAEALAFLGSDKLLKEVHASIIEAQKRGITGVPCTIFNDKYAISGGQTADVYLESMEKLVTNGAIVTPLETAAPAPVQPKAVAV